MLHEKLINPKSIAVIGASNNLQSPGGSVLSNLLRHNYVGSIYPVNPKETTVQGLSCYKHVSQLPDVDLAIIAISAKFVLETVQVLARTKNTRGFIIYSAGFSELNDQGKDLENQITKEITTVGGSLLGPNNIGMINTKFAGVFTKPIPKLNSKGVDFISSSGATAVFILETAMNAGIPFSSLYTVGNSAQISAEDVLAHLDEHFQPNTSPKVKLLYLESIGNPKKLLKHAKSLTKKGCTIAAIKAGSSEEGSRAASSHTGALANSDSAVEALFRKAGIIRCYGRTELISVAAILLTPKLKGKNIAIITHAGGPAVMLTDTLTKNGLNVPKIMGLESEELEKQLFFGSSVSNPIDFLATGTAEQLEIIINYCENKFPFIDGMAVIFGSPGLFEVYDVYNVLDKMMKTCKKPIYPILPSVVNVKKEIDDFVSKGNFNFNDEVIFGEALTKVYDNKFDPLTELSVDLLPLDEQAIRTIVEKSSNGYFNPIDTHQLLRAAHIPLIPESICHTKEECIQSAQSYGYPVVLKVVGPVHKSDVGGILLNIDTESKLINGFEELIAIKNTTGVLIQPYSKGIEVFVGAKREGAFGHLLLCGMGGIYIEVLKDVQSGLVPINMEDANAMIHNLAAYPILKGIRNQDGINISMFAQVIYNISRLIEIAPEIAELDLNPLFADSKKIFAVDARIRIEKI